MAKLDAPIDLTDVPEREEFTPVPPGPYTVMIVGSDIKTTQAGGQMIELEMDIQDGEHQNRKLFERINIVNANPKAVEIAYRTLAEIGKAFGKTSIKDTEELHNKRMTVNVVVDPAKPYKKDGVDHPGKPQNRITRYLPYAAQASVSKPSTTVSNNTSVVQTTEQPSSASVPPWKQKKS